MSASLNLPTPPLSVRFAALPGGGPSGLCYVRRGTPEDAGSALCGKGGFGCAYRYKRVDEFTPPDSYDPSASKIGQAPGAWRDANEAEEAVERLRSADAPMATRHLRPEASSVRSDSAQQQKQQKNQPVNALGAAGASLKKAPGVLVAKVCRTPETGSFDELARCGTLKREAREAEKRMSKGDASGEHTRIVRGEARLLRYLQDAWAREHPPRDGGRRPRPPIVQLLADVGCPEGKPSPTLGSSSGFSTAQEEVAKAGSGKQNGEAGEDAGKGGDEDDEDDNAGDPPPVRLLFFERLIDLDARLTPAGWVRDKTVWNMEAVEMAALEIASGLSFLHSHGVTHADVKPANLMRDAKTGQVKLIDFGASRRWVRLPNTEKENTRAVDQLDRAVQEGHLDRQRDILCEGLGSLTGTPHHCAPEVLLQACRYASADGWSRSTISDYASHPRLMPPAIDMDLFTDAAMEFDRGWGIKADVWSWGCTVLSLLGRTEGGEKAGTNTVCPFDFTFDKLDDALEPLHPVHECEKTLPRFHMWARCFPTRITAVFKYGVVLPPRVSQLSGALQKILAQTFRQQDERPSSHTICTVLSTRSSVLAHRRRSKAGSVDAVPRPATPTSVASAPLPASPASSLSSSSIVTAQGQTTYGTTRSAFAPPSPSVAVTSLSTQSVNRPITLLPNHYTLSEGNSMHGEVMLPGASVHEAGSILLSPAPPPPPAVGKTLAPPGAGPSAGGRGVSPTPMQVDEPMEYTDMDQDEAVASEVHSEQSSHHRRLSMTGSPRGLLTRLRQNSILKWNGIPITVNGNNGSGNGVGGVGDAGISSEGGATKGQLRSRASNSSLRSSLRSPTQWLLKRAPSQSHLPTSPTPSIHGAATGGERPGSSMSHASLSTKGGVLRSASGHAGVMSTESSQESHMPRLPRSPRVQVGGGSEQARPRSHTITPRALREASQSGSPQHDVNGGCRAPAPLHASATGHPPRGSDGMVVQEDGSAGPQPTTAPTLKQKISMVLARGRRRGSTITRPAAP